VYVVQGSSPYNSQLVLSQQLLLSVIEQMKLPMMHIARLAELQAAAGGQGVAEMRASAQAGLRLLESYELGVRLVARHTSFFEVEPVSVAGVLYDAAQELKPYAEAYGVTLELQLDGKYGPVMAHRQGLQTALVSLGSALVEALPAHDTTDKRLRLSAHRCRYGIVAGAYGDLPGISTESFRTGRQLFGASRQPLNAFLSGSGAGVFVADALLRAMQSHLSASRHHRQYGLGAVLMVNPQLRLM